jgi:broad specificity phosphatase PhoE
MRQSPARSLLRLLTGGLLLAAATLAVPAAAADFDLSQLKEGGYVVLLRHVQADDGADADKVNLADCATQRRVSAPGRAQAVLLSDRFHTAGISQAKLLASQWCRCQQTSELLGLGAVTPEPALNSPHASLASDTEMSARFQQFLAALKAPEAGSPLVLVTHSTAFAAMGQKPPKSGGGLVLKLNGTATPEVVGTISPPE